MTHTLPLDPAPRVSFDQASSSALSLLPNTPDAPAPATISANEMSRLTGVARERLRTWERRHGFPVPVRSANNVRRYLASDVRRISAISRLAASGMPLAEAITSVLDAPEPAGIESLGLGLDALGTPAIAVTGPRPLELVWRNGPTQAAADAPSVGDDLADGERTLGALALDAIRRLLAGETDGPEMVRHYDWMSAVPIERRSLAWRVDRPEAGAPPMVVLTQLPDAGREVPVERPTDATAWATGARRARTALQNGSGLQSVQRALRDLAAEVGAIDAAIGLLDAHGNLRLARSVRGTVTPTTSTLDLCTDVRTSLSDRQADWLDERTLIALGIDPRQRAVAVPLVVAERAVGTALLVFRSEIALGTVARELLLGVGATMAAVVERERAIARGAAA